MLKIKGCESEDICEDDSVVFGILSFFLYLFDIISNYLIALFFSVNPNKINKGDSN